MLFEIGKWCFVFAGCGIVLCGMQLVFDRFEWVYELGMRITFAGFSGVAICFMIGLAAGTIRL